MPRKKRAAEPLEDLLDEIVWTVPKLYFRMSAVSEELCREFGVTPGKRSVMRDIAINGPSRIADMAKARPVARQYIQRLAAELETDGLVRLMADPEDGRSKRVALTHSGRALLDRLAERHAALVPRLLEGATAERLRITADVLKALAERLKPSPDHVSSLGAPVAPATEREPPR